MRKIGLVVYLCFVVTYMCLGWWIQLLYLTIGALSGIAAGTIVNRVRSKP